MIEVKAELAGRSVYLAGETLECLITFTNVGRPKLSSPGKPRSAKMAWASAQIHCQCSVSETRVNLPPTPQLTSSEVTTTGKETSFIPSKGEKGSTILSTRPTILFCDLKLAHGESRTYTYRETIPIDAPPSFRGSSVKYSYKITIGTQRFDCPTKLLRVPFRVLVVPGLNDVSVYNEAEEMAPANPFLAHQRKENSLLDVALDVLQTITCRKGTNYYNITNSRGKVGRFCLFKQAYRIGDDIVGTFDFSSGTVPCVQYSVTLQSEEQISEECRKKASQGTTITSYSSHHECCLHTQKTHINIPIPLTATPGFMTDLVCLRWRLHFEFVTATKPLQEMTPASDPGEDIMWQAQSDIEVETMIWDLPIKVFSTNPLYASGVSLLQSESHTFI